MEAEAPEENAAAAAVAQITNRFSAINTADGDADGNVYSCKNCRTHLAVAGDIISKSFHSKHGKAYLFDKVINVTVGEKEDRMMITGMHSVADIFFVRCGENVGWKYGAVYDGSPKYKDGKFVLEG